MLLRSSGFDLSSFFAAPLLQPLAVFLDIPKAHVLDVRERERETRSTMLVVTQLRAHTKEPILFVWREETSDRRSRFRVLPQPSPNVRFRLIRDSLGFRFIRDRIEGVQNSAPSKGRLCWTSRPHSGHSTLIN